MEGRLIFLLLAFFGYRLLCSGVDLIATGVVRPEVGVFVVGHTSHDLNLMAKEPKLLLIGTPPLAVSSMMASQEQFALPHMLRLQSKIKMDGPVDGSDPTS